MVYRLKLSQRIVRRLVIQSSDSSDVDSDEEHMDLKNKQKSKRSAEIDGKPTDDCFKTLNNGLKGDDNRFTNFKIFVRNFGEKHERYVNTNDNFRHVLDLDSNLNQLIGCQDLDQLENVLLKTVKSLDNSSVEYESEVSENKSNCNGLPTEDSDQSKHTFGRELDSMKTLDSLHSEGIRKTKSKAFQLMCFVCDLSFNELQTALDHSRSDRHSKKKFGDDLKGIDALFTIDSESIGDVEIAIARRAELKTINSNDKQMYLDHGIRLKDGFGPKAYICSSCDLSFESLSQVINHMKSSELVVNPVEDPVNTFVINPLNVRLKNEGIKTIPPNNGFHFYCLFCNIYFDCKKTALAHTREARHKKIKLGENLNETDGRFVIQTERIGEFEVAFARRTALKTIAPDLKIRFTNEMIRLKDGIGSNAFMCLKCQQSIQTIEDISTHIKSLIHSMS